MHRRQSTVSKMGRAMPSLTALLLASCLAPGAGHATVREATPETLAKVLADAKGGDTIKLAPGDYPGVRMGRREFQPRLVIDAGEARIAGWWFRGVSGIDIRGGVYRLPPVFVNPENGRTNYGHSLRIDGSKDILVTKGRFIGPAASGEETLPYGEGYGLFMIGGSNIEVSSNVLAGYKSGMVLSRVDGFKVVDNTFTEMRSDGIQVAESRNGLVEGNQCGGTRIREGEHPDCIQMWSRPTSPPTADIVIRRNRIGGGTQGIGMFNHTRNGVDDGGFDRILIEDNDIEVGYPNAISLKSGRDSIVRNNRIRTLKDSKFRASINVGPGVTRCGNVVSPGAGKSGEKDKAC